MKKVTIVKSPGNAEQISVEVEWDGTETGWQREVQPVLARLDVRMHEQNMRVLRGAQRSRAVDRQAAETAAQILSMVNGVDLERAVASLEEAGVPV